MAKKATKDAKDLLAEARKRYKTATEADRENRKLAMDDLKFVHEPGEQWDPIIKRERGERPCYEFNRLRVTVKRIVNEIRANRPQGKVRAVEDNDKDTAQVYEGLIRNIWNVSDADAAVDNAAEYQVACGLGAWRVVTDYSSDTAWEQDILIKPIRNPFCVYPDPSAVDIMKRDARYWFITSKMAKEVFESKYGDTPVIEFEASEFDDDDWDDEDGYRIAEYWYKKPVVKTLYLLQDGATVEEVPAGQVPIRSREVQTSQIMMCVMSGDRILEGPTEWAGTKFPFVLVYGESVVIEGESKWWGLARHGKDSQRLHNASLTSALEAVALAPQAKWWATAAQAEGHVEKWAQAHKELLPFQLYNPDPMAPGAPQRMGGADVPAALIAMTQATGEELKASLGVFDPSLGAQSNATSGVAKRTEVQQGQIATFNYSDNVARGIRWTWEILTDLIPRVYDTERSIRILGSDGAESFAKVNHFDPMTGQVENDLSRGKFDVTITVGPSFSTQRQEAAEMYTQLAQAFPPVMQYAGDLIFKSMDLPYAEDMADRMRTLLPPPIQQMLQAKEQNNGKGLPPEAMQALAQADQAMQMVQAQAQQVQQAAQEAEGAKAEAEKAAANLQTQAAKMNADYQRILADIAKKEAALVLKEAQLVSKQTEAGVSEQGQAIATEREQLSAQVQAAMAQVQQQVADFMTQTAAAVSQMQQQTQVVPVQVPRSKVVRMRGPGGRTYEATVEEA